MILNIVNGGALSIGRLPNLLKELKEQGIEDYILWDGIHDTTSIKKSINLSHKQIVRSAKEIGLDFVIIAENDLVFTHPDSWNYYIVNKPLDFDIYLSMVFLGQIDENNEVKDFNGLTLYCVAKRFYDTFLSVPDDEHLDKALANLGKYVVCDPFVAKQSNGISGNTGKYEEYDRLYEGREFL